MSGTIEWLRLYGPAALAWVVLAARVLLVHRLPRDPGRRAVWVALSALAVLLTVVTPVSYPTVARVTGVPNLARLLAHAGMLVLAWATHAFLLHANHPPAVARLRSLSYACGLAGVLGLMGILFVLAPTPVDDVWFEARYASTPGVLEYWLVYLAGLTPAFAGMARAGWRFGGASTNPSLRLGLRLVAAGALCALAYHVHMACYFAANRFGLPYPAPGNWLLDRLLLFAAPVLVLVGAALPAWGARYRLPAPLGWLRWYRTYVTLRPLWLALYRANPGIALAPPPPALADLLVPRHLGLCLYRRVIEIRDGRLLLQPYLDPRVAADARDRAARAGLTGLALAAAVEADVLASALRDQARRPAGCTMPPPAISGGSDLDSDIRFLTEVARAYRRRCAAGRRRAVTLPWRGRRPTGGC